MRSLLKLCLVLTLSRVLKNGQTYSKKYCDATPLVSSVFGHLPTSRMKGLTRLKVYIIITYLQSLQNRVSIENCKHHKQLIENFAHEI